MRFCQPLGFRAGNFVTRVVVVHEYPPGEIAHLQAPPGQPPIMTRAASAGNFEILLPAASNSQQVRNQ